MKAGYFIALVLSHFMGANIPDPTVGKRFAEEIYLMQESKS
jgi:hypothetical protein